MQASGSATQTNPIRGILDRHTLTNMVGNAVNGSTLDYCRFNDFTNPVDITALVSSLAGGATITPTTVPRTDVSSDDVGRIVRELAVVFFRATLENKGLEKLGCYLDQRLAHDYEQFIVEIQHTAAVYECDE